LKEETDMINAHTYGKEEPEESYEEPYKFPITTKYAKLFLKGHYMRIEKYGYDEIQDSSNKVLKIYTPLTLEEFLKIKNYEIVDWYTISKANSQYSIHYQMELDGERYYNYSGDYGFWQEDPDFFENENFDNYNITTFEEFLEKEGMSIIGTNYEYKEISFNRAIWEYDLYSQYLFDNYDGVFSKAEDIWKIEIPTFEQYLIDNKLVLEGTENIGKALSLKEIEEQSRLFYRIFDDYGEEYRAFLNTHIRTFENYLIYKGLNIMEIDNSEK
jgi:hypothetical protein